MRKFRVTGGAGLLSAALLSGVMLPSAALAQDEDATGFTIEGSVRARYEAIDGNFRPGSEDSDDVVLLRTLVETAYQGDGFQLGATLQDSRAYANDEDTPIGNSDINALELIELYAAVDLTDEVTVTVGRQIINLGSKRLVGSPNSRNAATAFTGARIEWEAADGARVNGFYVLPQQRLPADDTGLLDNKVVWDRESDDLVFWGLHYQRPNVGPFTIEAYVYGLDEDDRADNPTRNRQLITPGMRLSVRPQRGHFDTELEGAWQTGTIRTSTSAMAGEVDVDAYMLHGEIGYTFDTPIQPRLVLFADLATGDDESSNDFNKFDPLFGPRYTDFGMTGLYGPLGYSNMQAVGVRAFARFSPELDAQVNWRALWLDSATQSFASTGVRDATGAAGRDAGSQFEVRVRWEVIPDMLTLDAGSQVLVQGRFFDLAPNASGNGDTVFGYSALTFEF